MSRPAGAATGSALPAVRAAYQPIVDLQTGAVVAFEALARGPQGSELESPAALFAQAERAGLAARLDVECQAAALRGALERRLPSCLPLFVNTEPRWLAEPWPSHLAPLAERAGERLQVVMEITERALVGDPAGLLGAVRRIRSAGGGVALDDVGADPASLALMPFIEPDVIKLDLRLVQERTRGDVAAIINAVIAQAERSGAVIVAEGIETQEHRNRALAMGATLGQGWLFGRPGPLPADLPRRGADLAFTREHREPAVTPFETVRRVRPLRTAAAGLLLPMSHHLERHALRTDEKPVLLSAFQDVEHFTPATAERYRRLAGRCSYVGVLGAGMSRTPADGVRGADLDRDDPLRGEWVVCVVGPHFAGALIANDLGDTGPDRDRRFEMAVSYDRELVLAAARSLFGRIDRLPA